MQMTAPLRRAVARFRTGRGWRRPRHLALASITLLVAQCGPTECAPAPAPAAGRLLRLGRGRRRAAVRRRLRRPPCGAAAPRSGPGNAGYNATTWGASSATYPRATGNFTGTTDEIIQWAACKWGFDEDTLRAQVVKESYWTQTTLGDWSTDAGVCAPGHPIGADGRPGQCPESVGLMQVRTPVLPRRRSTGRCARRRTTSTSPSTPGATATRARTRGSTPSSAGATTPPATPGAASASGSADAGTPPTSTPTSPRCSSTSATASGRPRVRQRPLTG